MAFPKIFRKERLCKIYHKEVSEESAWKVERKPWSCYKFGGGASIKTVGYGKAGRTGYLAALFSDTSVRVFTN